MLVVGFQELGRAFGDHAQYTGKRILRWDGSGNSGDQVLVVFGFFAGKEHKPAAPSGANEDNVHAGPTIRVKFGNQREYTTSIAWRVGHFSESYAS
jgi:hypothetical protein